MRSAPHALLIVVLALCGPSPAKALPCFQWPVLPTNPIGLYGLDGAIGPILGTGLLGGFFLPAGTDGGRRNSGSLDNFSILYPHSGTYLGTAVRSGVDETISNDPIGLRGLDDGFLTIFGNPWVLATLQNLSDTLPIHQQGTFALFNRFCYDNFCFGSVGAPFGFRTNFGSHGCPTETASVPEPSTTLLVALGLIGMASRRQFRPGSDSTN